VQEVQTQEIRYSGGQQFCFSLYSKSSFTIQLLTQWRVPAVETQSRLGAAKLLSPSTNPLIQNDYRIVSLCFIGVKASSFALFFA
jgi:hypothetical protein